MKQIKALFKYIEQLLALIGGIKFILSIIAFMYLLYTLNNLAEKIETGVNVAIETKEDFAKFKDFVTSGKMGNTVDTMKTELNTATDKIIGVKQRFIKKWDEK